MNKYIRCTSYWKLKEPYHGNTHVTGGLHINTDGETRLVIFYVDSPGQDGITVAYKRKFELDEEITTDTIEGKLAIGVFDDLLQNHYNKVSDCLFSTATKEESELYWKLRETTPR